MIVQEVESNVCICVVDLHCISLFALIIVANIAYEPHYLYIESATSFACKCLCFFFKKSKSLIESQKCKVSIGVLITGKSKHGSRLACFALYCYFFVTFFRMTGGEAATYRLRSILE